jgi:hypothetical protein
VVLLGKIHQNLAAAAEDLHSAHPAD